MLSHSRTSTLPHPHPRCTKPTGRKKETGGICKLYHQAITAPASVFSSCPFPSSSPEAKGALSA